MNIVLKCTVEREVDLKSLKNSLNQMAVVNTVIF